MNPITLDLPLAAIDPSIYPLRHSQGASSWDNGVGELAASLGTDGQISPVTVVVKPGLVLQTMTHDWAVYPPTPKSAAWDPVARASCVKAPAFDLVAGHRRLEAARSLNWERLRATVRYDLQDSPAAILALAIAENAQREALTLTERAEAEARLKRAEATAGRVAYRDTAGRLVNPGRPSFGRLRSQSLGVSERTVDNLVTLGEATPAVRHAVDTRVLSETGGYSASRFDPALQPGIVAYLASKGVSRAGPDDVHTAATVVGSRMGVPVVKNGAEYAPKQERLLLSDRLERLEGLYEAAQQLRREFPADRPWTPGECALASAVKHLEEP